MPQALSLLSNCEQKAGCALRGNPGKAPAWLSQSFLLIPAQGPSPHLPPRRGLLQAQPAGSEGGRQGGGERACTHSPAHPESRPSAAHPGLFSLKARSSPGDCLPLWPRAQHSPRLARGPVPEELCGAGRNTHTLTGTRALLLPSDLFDSALLCPIVFLWITIK